MIVAGLLFGRILCVAVLSLALADCSMRQAAPHIGRSYHPEVGENLQEGLARAESRALVDTGGRAAREGDTLRLALMGAPEARLKDFEACEGGDREPKDFGAQINGDCVRYRLYAYWPDKHAYMVSRIGFEFEEILWIDDRTGKITTLLSEPQFSPRADYFFIYGDRDMNAEQQTFELYRVDVGGPIREWESHVVTDTQAATARSWSHDKIIIESHSADGTKAPDIWALKRNDDAWQLDMNGP